MINKDATAIFRFRFTLQEYQRIQEDNDKLEKKPFKIENKWYSMGILELKSVYGYVDITDACKEYNRLCDMHPEYEIKLMLKDGYDSECDKPHLHDEEYRCCPWK